MRCQYIVDGVIFASIKLQSICNYAGVDLSPAVSLKPKTGRIFCSMTKLIWFAPVLFIAAGCSSISVDSSWKDSNYRGGPFTNIAVRVIDHDAIIGAFLEDKFCDELRKRGVKVSHLAPTAVLEPTAQDEDSPARLAAPGVQAVLVAREGDRQLTQIQTDGTPRIDPTSTRRMLKAAQDLERWQCQLCLISDMKAVWTTRIDIQVEEIADRAAKLTPLAKTTVDRLQLDGLTSGTSR